MGRMVRLVAEISPKIKFYDADKLSKINPQTLELWRKYEIDMSLRELSERSKQGYLNDSQHWWIYIYDYQDNKCVTALTEDDITEFLYYCKSNGNNSRRMKRRISTMKAFYKFLRKKKIIIENPMEFIETPKKDVDIITQTFLTADQVALMREKLQEQVDNAEIISRKHSALQKQVYALFSLSTMARVTAVSSVEWKQVDFDERVVTDVLEKEGKVVDLYFSEEVRDLLAALKTFREENEIDDGGYLFCAVYDSGSGRVTTGTLNQWCKDIGNLIGVPTLHPHDFRHSGSQLLKLAGMELEDVSALLNHSGTDVTVKHYLRPDRKKIRSTKDKFNI